MNKIYRVIWSKAKNCYVVASEFAKRNGKSAQKAVVGAIITGILSVGMAGNVLAADFGNSYDAAAMLSAVTTDDGTGLGFSMVRGDKQADVLNGNLGIVKSGNNYQAGYYTNTTFHAFANPGDGSIESAYAIVEAAAKNEGSTYYKKSIYFDYASLPAYLKNVKGYSDEQ